MKSICKTIDDDKFWIIPNSKKHYLSYYNYGVLHKEDGPAVEFKSGRIYWLLKGDFIKPTNKMMEKYIKLNPDNISKDYLYPLKIQLLAIKLKPSVIFDIKHPNKKTKTIIS